MSDRRGLFSWALYDWASSSYAAVIQTFVFAAYFTQHVAQNPADGTYLWAMTVSASGMVVALCSPIAGAISDQAGHRKRWLAFFTMLCVIVTALLWFVKPSQNYIFTALFLIFVGDICVELSYVFYNAMLPSLVDSSRIGRWSGWGWAMGYIGGTVCLVLVLFVFVSDHAPHWWPPDHHNEEQIRAVFPTVAAWLLLFSLPLFLYTQDTSKSPHKSLSQATREGLKQLWQTFRQIRKYKTIARLLLGRMIYIDGLATLFAFGGIYAAGTFHMSQNDIILFGIAMNISAGLGAALFALVDDIIGAKRTILIGLFGLILFGTGILIVDNAALFWLLSLCMGLFVGPVQASSRSYLARITPQELTNQMFGFFALSGRVTAFFGPLILGWITYATGSQRLGMSALIVFFIIGGCIIATLPNGKIPHADIAKE